MVFMFNCKYCGTTDDPLVFVKFFEASAITTASQNDKRLPKYGHHLGIECSLCGRWQRWLPQTHDLTNKKFYQEGQVLPVKRYPD